MLCVVPIWVPPSGEHFVQLLLIIVGGRYIHDDSSKENHQFRHGLVHRISVFSSVSVVSRVPLKPPGLDTTRDMTALQSEQKRNMETGNATGTQQR
ncbi:hypothetical protein OUZ56_004269 [Daphnia magna]|uniref:Uncharacterized protein n=1 Tax=Daphnia magna TaxID=35525 RepID=A0ABQ9YPF5_9CRUS|nr:hypothetical protein OUZ56_004269 [Daphnia magna]